MQWNRVSTDSIWIVFQPWKTAFHKPLPQMESGISLTTRQLFSHFHCIWLRLQTSVPTTMAQSVHWVHLDSFPPMENSLPQTLSTHGMERWYFCDHQTTFQSFSLHLTMATNFLCPLQWNTVSTDSIWIVFQPWKTAFHKPLLQMERWYFCDHQTAFQSFSLHLTMATNVLYPLRWHRVFTDSIWIAFHLWKTPF